MIDASKCDYLNGFKHALIEASWTKANPVPDRPGYCTDAFGDLIRFRDYGNRESPFGWEVDCVSSLKPHENYSRQNFQALHWRNKDARRRMMVTDSVPEKDVPLHLE